MLVIHGLSLPGKQTPQTSLLLYPQRHHHHSGHSTNVFKGLEDSRFTIVSPEVNAHQGRRVDMEERYVKHKVDREPVQKLSRR